MMHPSSLLVRCWTTAFLPPCWHTRCTDAFQVPSCCFGGRHCKSLPDGPIKEASQDVLRFLWIDDPDNEHPNIFVKRFNRVVFGVTSSPFLLNATIRHHVTKYEAYHPQFVSDFLTSLHGDDFKRGKDSVPEAFQLYTKARSIMKEAGFH